MPRSSEAGRSLFAIRELRAKSGIEFDFCVSVFNRLSLASLFGNGAGMASETRNAGEPRALLLGGREQPRLNAGRPGQDPGAGGFRSALRRFRAFSEEASKEAGITAQQYQAMLAVAAFDGAMPQGELAQEMLLKPNATVQLVDRRAASSSANVATPTGARCASRSRRRGTMLFKLAADHLDQLKKREKQFADILRRLRQTRAA
jgi:hypothetical protein